MKEELIIRYITYAIKNNKQLRISTKNRKTYDIKDIKYNVENKMLEYHYANNGKEAKIKIENVMQIELTNPEEQKEFAYKILSERYNTINLKKKLEEFKEYYLEIIDELLARESQGTKGYINLNNKKKMYPRIFDNLHKDERNLLFQYFTQKAILKSGSSQNGKEILLIEQANLSQKEALNNALNKEISIIQGPPGTGKTTTIINILANLLYRNKKVLVVSKNNSAIGNVVEELSEMKLPKYFIRMRKFRCNARTT